MKEINSSFSKFINNFANKHGGVGKEVSLKLHQDFRNGLTKQNLIDLSSDSFKDLDFVFQIDENNIPCECISFTRGETDYLSKDATRQINCSKYARSALASSIKSGKKVDGRFSVMKMIDFLKELLRISLTDESIGKSYNIKQIPLPFSESSDDLDNEFEFCKRFMERYPNEELTKRTKQFYIAGVKTYAEKVRKDSSSFLSEHE